jgi:hypothetical protein
MRMRGQVSVKRYRANHKYVESKRRNQKCLNSETVEQKIKCFVGSVKSKSNSVSFGVAVDSDLS